MNRCRARPALLLQQHQLTVLASPRQGSVGSSRAARASTPASICPARSRSLGGLQQRLRAQVDRVWLTHPPADVPGLVTLPDRVCGQRSGRPRAARLVLGADAAGLQGVAPGLEDDELGEHGVVAGAGVDRVGPLQP